MVGLRQVKSATLDITSSSKSETIDVPVILQYAKRVSLITAYFPDRADRLPSLEAATQVARCDVGMRMPTPRL